MTSPQGLPVGMAFTLHPHDPDEPEEKTGPTVGAADAEADAAASGADVPATHAERDSDGVPVGEEDAEADRRASGA